VTFDARLRTARLHGALDRGSPSVTARTRALARAAQQLKA
jgi:hypothetical protein